MIEAFVELQGGRRTAGRGADRCVPWWSFGKTVIALTALRLADQGRLDLNAAGMLALLRHKARLPDYGGLPAYHRAAASGEPPWSPDDLRRRVAAEPRLRVTADWSYSNIGYLKARELIENAGRADLGVLARELVFDPLRLTQPRLAVTPEDLSDVDMGTAAGYQPGWVYHGLFVGPLADAAAVLDGILDSRGRLLSEASRRVLLEPHDLPQHVRPPWSAAAYGAGVMLPRLADGGPAIGHTGSGPGSALAVYRRLGGPGRTVAAFAFSDRETEVEAAAAERLAAP